MQQWRLLWCCCLAEIIGDNLLFTGLVFAGSGVYTVIYSSVTVFVALIRIFWLNRPLTLGQWVSIIAICCGLAATCISSRDHGTDVILGVILTFAGSVSMAVMYVVCEHLLSTPSAPPPESVSMFVGLVGSVVMTGYAGVRVFPHRQSFLLDPVAEKGGHVATIVGLFALVIVCDFGHYMAFYRICTGNAVSAGVNKAVQSIGIFGLSAILFCNEQESQCFNWVKGMAAVVVGGGVIGYNVFKSDTAQEPATTSLQVGQLLQVGHDTKLYLPEARGTAG